MTKLQRAGIDVIGRIQGEDPESTSYFYTPESRRGKDD